jgi:cobalt-precorrin-6B (C15)-methyltransferase
VTVHGDEPALSPEEEETRLGADGDEQATPDEEPDDRLEDDESDLWSPGLPDTAFVRGGAAIFPSEVRVLVLAKAHLYPTARVLDIGAGGGGLTVEAALLCSEGEVVAYEHDQQARSVLRLNLDRFDLESVRIAESRSLRTDELGRFDRVLLSGDSRIAETLEAIPQLLDPGGRMVAITGSVESTGRIIAALRGWPWEGLEAVQMSLARAAPSGQMLQLKALDPVWIIAADLARVDRGRPSRGHKEEREPEK